MYDLFKSRPSKAKGRLNLLSYKRQLFTIPKIKNFGSPFPIQFVFKQASVQQNSVTHAGMWQVRDDLIQKMHLSYGLLPKEVRPPPRPLNFGTFGALFRKSKLLEFLGHYFVS